MTESMTIRDPKTITVIDVKRFLEHGAEPIKLQEMAAFWKLLSDDEKNDFRDSVARWDGQSEFTK